MNYQLNAQVGTSPNLITVPILATASDGRKFIIALSGPLTTDHPASPEIAQFQSKGGQIKVIVENELIVRGNLPAATLNVQQQLGI